MTRVRPVTFPTVAIVSMVLFASVGLSAAAQSRSSNVYGTVTDPSDAVLPGVSVVLTDEATGIARDTVTDARGHYAFPLVPVGRFTITASLSGFAPAEARNVVVQIQEDREINIKLSISVVAENVTVTAGAVQVETTTASLGQVINERQVAELPLNGRNFVQLGTLVPGAVKGEGSFFNNRGNTEVSIRGTVSLSIQGMRENSNDWLLDGIDNNELTAGAVSILPSVESIQEFKVLTNNYSAEYGSRAGGTVIVSTKSGSNKLAGSLFEYLRNDALDARNFFDGPKKGKYNQNQFGGSLGGPIKRGKTFFFGDYQGTLIRQGLTFLSQVPTERMRAGDFNESFAGAPRRIIYDPATTRVDPVTGLQVRDPFPNNQIPLSRIDPVALRLLALFPLPQLSDRLAGNYLSNPVRTFDQHSFNARVDHTMSSKDSLFVRFSFDSAKQFFPNGLPGFGSGPSAAFSTTDFDTQARNLAASWTRLFSSSKVNQATFGYNRVFNRMTSIGQGTNKSNEVGIPGANLGQFVNSGLTNISIAGGYNRLGDRLFTPFIGGTQVYHVVDTFNWVAGRHSFKLGGSVRWMLMDTLGITWPTGNFNFDGLFTAGFTATGALDASTGNPMASFLLGLPASGSRSNQFGEDIVYRRWNEYRGFAEDTLQLTNDLTLNYGLAYALTTPQVEKNDRQANFDPATGQFLIPGVNADRAAGVRTDTNNFEPRVGFVWSPGEKKWAVRGGYGIFHDVSGNGGVQGLYLNPPFTSELGFTSNNITPVRTLSTGFAPVPQPNPANYPGNVVVWDRDYQQGLVQQYNVNVQRELPGNVVVTAAYAGSRGRNLQGKGFNTNSAPPGPGNNTASRRPFPQYNNFNLIVDRGEVDYDALQLKGEKRLSGGLYLLTAYTFSQSMTNGLSQNVGVNTGVKYFPYEPYPGADRGLADTDVRHSFTLSYVYDIPLASAAATPVKALFGEWQMNGILRMRTGYPLSMSMAVNQSGTGIGNRPDRVCDGALSSGERSVDRWFDTSCFVAPPAGRFGNAARTTLTGPGLVNFDLSFIKNFPLAHSKAQFRTEIFNLFNTAQFDLPVTTVGNANFGRIQATVAPSRQVQFALRYQF
ncbi:MAG: carboxypeptidase regulatory-like domain-containing protein [Vicinamibacterales bacterium]